jgi:hypothetical protein
MLVHIIVPELREVAANGHLRAPYQCSPGKNTRRRLTLTANLHIGGSPGPQLYAHDGEVTHHFPVDGSVIDLDSR